MKFCNLGDQSFETDFNFRTMLFCNFLMLIELQDRLRFWLILGAVLHGGTEYYTEISPEIFGTYNTFAELKHVLNSWIKII